MMLDPPVFRLFWLEEELIFDTALMRVDLFTIWLALGWQLRCWLLVCGRTKELQLLLILDVINLGIELQTIVI